MFTAPKADRHTACPLCRKPTAPDFTPFCGAGCRDRDLLNWLGDAYRVPGPDADTELTQNPRRRLEDDA